MTGAREIATAALSDALPQGQPRPLAERQERRQQLVYLAWTLGLLLLINGLYIYGVLSRGDAGVYHHDPHDHFTELQPGPLSP